MNDFFKSAHLGLKSVGVNIDIKTLETMGNKQVLTLLKMNKLPWRAGITKPTLEKRKVRNRRRNSYKGIKTT